MGQTVVGIFDSAGQAQNAVQHLVSEGFSQEDIDIAAESSTENLNDTRFEKNTEDEGIGEKISRFFSNLFDSDDEAENYRKAAKNGSVVTVYTQSEDEAERAARMLDQYGAVDVDEKAKSYNEYENRESSYRQDADDTLMSGRASLDERTERMGFEGTSSLRDDVRDDLRDDVRNDVRDNITDETNRSIPIIEEELNLGKETVDKGKVRLRSRIIERPVEETIRLREERVRVERNPVNRPATEADLNAFREEEIELSETEERAVVDKQARVVEEVHLEKDVEERDETIRETLRKTDVDVENIKDRTKLDRDKIDPDRDSNI